MGWIGIELDGTLAYSDVYSPVAMSEIGAPVTDMVAHVKDLLSQDVDVRIFTSRGSEMDKLQRAMSDEQIYTWCLTHLGVTLPVTNVMDHMCLHITGARFFRNIRNSGLILQEIFVSIGLELNRARAKFPSSECSMVALTEEVGELAKAMLDESQQRIYQEAVQVACMAIRVATEGDPSIENYRAKR